MGTIMNLFTPVLDKFLYMGTTIQLLGNFLVMKKDFASNAMSNIRGLWIINDCLSICPSVHMLIWWIVCGILEWPRVQSNVHRLTQGCQYRFTICLVWNRLAKASKVYSGSSKSWMKNLYRFYSACRQTILFTWRGGMGTTMNLFTPVLDKLLYMGTMIELLG